MFWMFRIVRIRCRHEWLCAVREQPYTTHIALQLARMIGLKGRMNVSVNSHHSPPRGPLRNTLFMHSLYAISNRSLTTRVD